VNFIGVPIAAWQGFQEWVGSGVPANEFSMGALGKKSSHTNTITIHCRDDNGCYPVVLF
jgi:hypothetical protein